MTTELLKQQMLSLLQKTMLEVVYNPLPPKSLWDNSGKNVSDLSDPNFRMRIDRVDNLGKAYILFSKPLELVQNASLIDPTVLIVALDSGIGNRNDKRDLNFTWSTLNMSSTQLKI